MDQVLDEPLSRASEDGVKYGGFWPRLVALIIDGLVLSPLTIGIPLLVRYVTMEGWIVTVLLAAVNLFSITYKPYMEFEYGATLGKMAMKLKVVNLRLAKASLEEIILRNTFNIVPSVIALLVSLGLYFPGVSFGGSVDVLQVIKFANVLIVIVDLVVMLSDPRSRSLHDKLGRTLVLDNR